MTEKKTAEEYFKESLKYFDPVIQEQFPEYKDILKVAKTLSTVKFRTRYNCFIDDCEHPDPVSVVEPGRAESLDHLVQRLTAKPNPTMRDLNYLAIKQQGSAEFEDPTEMTQAEIDERMERVVAVGDKIDAEEALIETVKPSVAVEQAAVTSKQATQERVSEEPGRSETSKATLSGEAKSA